MPVHVCVCGGDGRESCQQPAFLCGAVLTSQLVMLACMMLIHVLFTHPDIRRHHAQDPNTTFKIQISLHCSEGLAALCLEKMPF